MHVLQSIQWPSASAIGTSELLYFRAEPRPAWYLSSPGRIKGGPVPLGGQQRIDFSTFFSAFSLSTWCGLAGLEEVVLQIECRGRAMLEVYQDNGHEPPHLLLQKRIVGDGRPQSVDVRELKGLRGMLYPVFILNGGDELDLISLNYCTRVAPRVTPRLAIVMPTFKREQAVTQNIARISAGVLASHPECRLFVIDNGRSLQIDPPAGVEVIRSENFGGSGGYARGMLEVTRPGHDFTHVLLCDDDALVNPPSIVRLIALLGYVSDTVVSGGMLQLNARHVLDQKSVNAVGLTLRRNREFNDMTLPENIARYDEPGFGTACGWWFACYPLEKGKQRFLPMPYFIHWDDIEMGRRCHQMGLRITSLLGVATWHEDFDKRAGGYREFYWARNGMITAMLYEKSRLALKQVIAQIYGAMLTYRYDRAQFMLEGLDAVMRGPQALREVHADEQHQALLARPQVRFEDVSAYVVPDKLPEKKKKLRVLAIVARLTMNGHLLPPWWFKSAREPSFPGWIVEDLNSHALARIFLARKVVYYEPTTGRGLLCAVSHRRYFGLLLGLLSRWVVLWLRRRSVRDLWRSEHAQLSSPEFWRRHMGLPEA